MATPMPAMFFGHGNPMNALTSNAWTQGVERPLDGTFHGPARCFVYPPTGIYRPPW